MKSIYAIATYDTKSLEIEFVANCIRELGATVRTVDVSTKFTSNEAADINASGLTNGADLSQLDRGVAVSKMSDSLQRFLVSEHSANQVAGVIGIGGSGGTALITAAMRSLPIGLPKLMVSTMASGNVAPYIDCSDITMVYSVVDVAGLNRVSTTILANAAHAIKGMVLYQPPGLQIRQTLGMTMFGVTTPCVNAVRELLERQGFDCLTFHATGSGGRAMEKLVESGMITGVLDITTTEVADEIVGGVLSAGDQRFDAMIKQAIPLVVSVGAVDMVNFGAIDTVPEQFRTRNLHVHNAQVTLMHTTPQENQLIARWIANKLNGSTAPVTILIPEGGVSMLDAPGQPFHEPDADAALFSELETQVQQTDFRQIVRLPYHINDPAFAQAAVDHFGVINEG